MNIFYIAFLHLSRIFKDKKVIIIMFIIPTILVSFFSSAGKKSGNIKEYPVRVGVVNKDTDAYSTKLISYLKASKRFNISILKEEDALIALGQNKIQAFVVLPNDFSKNLMEKTVPSLEVKALEGSNTYMSLVENINSFLGEEIYSKKVELTKEILADSSSKSNFNLLLPNFIINFVLFSMIYITNELIDMRNNKTLRRNFSTPNSKVKILLSILLAMFFLLSLQAFFLIGISKFVFGFYWGNSIAALILVIASLVFVALTLGILISRFAKNQGQVVGFVNLIVTPTCIISGSFMPKEFLPEIFNKLAYFTPQNWSTKAITDMALNNGGVLTVLPSVGILLLFGIAFLTASQYIIKIE